MLPADRDIFQVTMAHRREFHSLSTLRSFYNWAKPIVDVSIRDAAVLGQRGRKLTSYFAKNIPAVPPWLHDVIHIPVRPRAST